MRPNEIENRDVNRIYYHNHKLHYLWRIYDDIIIISSGCRFYSDCMTTNNVKIIAKSDLEKFVKIDPNKDYDLLMLDKTINEIRVVTDYDNIKYTKIYSEPYNIISTPKWNSNVRKTIEECDQMYMRESKLKRILK